MGMSKQDAWKNRDFIILGGSAVAEFVTDAFLGPYEVCRFRSVSDPRHANGMLTTGQKVGCVVNGLYSKFGPLLFRQKPHTRSNTTTTGDHKKTVFPDALLPAACQACPRTQTTFPHKWQIRTTHQSNEKFICGDYTTEFENDHIFEFANEENEENSKENGKFVGSDYTTEFDKETDDLLKENFMTVYVKTVNANTISIKCEGKMTAAVISEEVERRSLIPRDMTYLVHKGNVMSEKKTIKENNIEAEATLEMSLGLLGGMEKNEQMDTHETEEDREEKRKLEEGKEGKMTKPNDDTVYLT